MMTATIALLVLALLCFVGAGDGFRSYFSRQKLPRAISGNSMQWWDDLAPPFAMEQTQEEKSDWTHQNQDVTHFCFLVHGHRGLSKVRTNKLCICCCALAYVYRYSRRLLHALRQDLSYLQAVMQSLAEQEKRKRFAQDGLVQDIVVHSVVCNEGKTTDGVANGGQRLMEEILQVIQEHTHKDSKITISIVGNSLGGIYGRYAIAKLAESMNGNMEFNIFCTTATPHLGISRHTYLPLPRTAEIGVAHALGSTGKDLYVRIRTLEMLITCLECSHLTQLFSFYHRFRLNDLMKTMATSQEFISPLGSFRKRIAYANAYGTDFPVPAETAAFLSADSTYPHHFMEEQLDADDDSCDRLVVDDSGLVIATLHTPQRDNDDGACLNEEHTDELVQMSTALDALGWKKVFVDVRKEMPMSVRIPRRLGRRGLNNRNHDNSSGSEEDATAPLDVLRQKGIVESRDVATAVKMDTSDPYHRLSLPMGHNMIVAFSRTRMSAYMNKGGRPVVDALAKELVEDIFSWKEDSS